VAHPDPASALLAAAERCAASADPDAVLDLVWRLAEHRTRCEDAAEAAAAEHRELERAAARINARMPCVDVAAALAALRDRIVRHLDTCPSTDPHRR
jgi:hypothetical protein